jgi:hypothetical protein
LYVAVIIEGANDATQVMCGGDHEDSNMALTEEEYTKFADAWAEQDLRVGGKITMRLPEGKVFAVLCNLDKPLGFGLGMDPASVPQNVIELCMHTLDAEPEPLEEGRDELMYTFESVVRQLGVRIFNTKARERGMLCPMYDQRVQKIYFFTGLDDHQIQSAIGDNDHNAGAQRIGERRRTRESVKAASPALTNRKGKRAPTVVQASSIRKASVMDLQTNPHAPAVYVNAVDTGDLAPTAGLKILI